MADWAIGIDLGGTKIEVALVDAAGNIAERKRIPTDAASGYAVILTHLESLVKEICQQHPDKFPLTVGMGVAGQIDNKTGTIRYAPNLNWKNVPLPSDLSQKLNIPVTITNDVRAAMVGEWLYGAGKNCSDLVCIFVGTGIGGGIVSAGKILEGVNNTAGEIGHMTIDVHGPECHCGNKGCFEALAGGWGIERTARQMVEANPEKGRVLLKIAGSDIYNITAKTIGTALEENDFLAKQLIDNLAENLIAGGVSIVHAFGPKRLIWGGGIIEGFPALLPVVEKGIRARTLQAASNGLEVLPAALHNDAGVIGAAAFALKTLKNR